MISHKVDMNWELKINLSTWADEGLLLWQGPPSDAFSFESNDIAVGIAGGEVQFVSNNKKLSVMKKVNDGQEHKISVKKEGTKITLDVDGLKNSDEFANLEDQTLMEELQDMDFYLGGLPDDMSTDYFNNKGFAGCIHYLDAYNKPKPGTNMPSYGGRVKFGDSEMNRGSQGVQPMKECSLGNLWYRQGGNFKIAH